MRIGGAGGEGKVVSESPLVTPSKGCASSRGSDMWRDLSEAARSTPESGIAAEVRVGVAMALESTMGKA